MKMVVINFPQLQVLTIGEFLNRILPKYTNQSKAIGDHVDPENRAKFDELYGGMNRSPLKKTPETPSPPQCYNKIKKPSAYRVKG